MLIRGLFAQLGIRGRVAQLVNSARATFGQAHEPDVISYFSRRGSVLIQFIGHEDRYVSESARRPNDSFDSGDCAPNRECR